MAKIDEVNIDVPLYLKEVLRDFIDAEYERRSMINFIRENTKDFHDLSTEAPKHLKKRYGIYPNRAHPGLAWYLLDEYFKGNITIKKHVVSE